MSEVEGFAPIVSPHSSLLILGSMPGAASLRKQQYYGHPGNAFWPIMGALFAAYPELGYQLRKEILIENGVAVWDVLQSCKRLGSLDSNIELSSIIINDFTSFFDEYKLIRRVYFNGGMAEKVYKKHILPTLNQRFSYLEYQRLPSTSPAFATLTLAQKIAAWQAIRQDMLK
ncbi:T/U mismatch-specific DNA glycosylase [Candidatus Methylobacter favarea]|uniref:T/U mismatch-specific DNA glycosylase n=1 Tax=Candidatus Methylobacter favarea TaxID=2707345 RepID=A0A8S0WCL3_9GAMM|nr:DNA-deoxyinosine glycosylase [Candidatus Methylobacter favarea]CAA9892615.1 T/U mismatch-specific DNA glycosylase [Candidatus Methylobacter favarea]